MSATAEQVLEANPWRAMIGRMTISRAADLWLDVLAARDESHRTIDTYRRFLYRLDTAYRHTARLFTSRRADRLSPCGRESGS